MDIITDARSGIFGVKSGRTVSGRGGIRLEFVADEVVVDGARTRKKLKVGVILGVVQGFGVSS